MQISESVTIHAPLPEVFERLRDLDRATESMPGIHKVEVLAGPARMEVGTRWRETRRMFGQEATEEMEVVALQENSHYDVGADRDDVRYLSTFRVAPVGTAQGEATRVTMEFGAEPKSRGAKVMGVLMRPMSKMVAKQCRKDLLDLKASLER